MKAKHNYQSNYNHRAFENHIRRSKALGSKGSLFFIVLISFGIILLLALILSKETNDLLVAFIPLLVLFVIGDVIMVKNYIEEKNERKKRNKSKKE